MLTVERSGTPVDLTVSPVTGAGGSLGGRDGWIRVRVDVSGRCGGGELADVHRDDGGRDPGFRRPCSRSVDLCLLTKSVTSGVVSVVGVGRLAGEVTGDSQALGLRDTRQVVSAEPPGVAQHGPLRFQPHPIAAAGRRAHSGRSTRECVERWPACVGRRIRPGGHGSPCSRYLGLLAACSLR